MKNLKKITYAIKQKVDLNPKEWGIKSENGYSWTIVNKKTGEEKTIEK